MRLVRFGAASEERPGMLLDDETILDLGEHVHDFDRRFWSEGGLDELRRCLQSGSLERSPRHRLQDVRLGSPVPRPDLVVCIGLNYVDHAEESGLEVPGEPVIFSKAPNTVIGPHDDVLIPPGSEKTDWEVELAVVIGSEARYLANEEVAAEHIAGYTISNDVSERAYQLERGGQWIKGKSCETFNPLGPWLMTSDEIDDVHDLRLRLRVNGELAQDGSTANMVFGVHHLVWYVSQFMVLEPGTIINTGTPAGVGLGQSPPRFLAPGDVMELSITGLGEQRQRVVAAGAGHA